MVDSSSDGRYIAMGSNSPSQFVDLAPGRSRGQQESLVARCVGV